MILYGSGMSPFVRKVLVVAREKGVELTVEPVGMGRITPDFAQASPFGKIPALRDPGADGGRDFCLADSTAIVTYIEAKHPEPALIPTAPIARARTIWYDEFADTILTKAGSAIFFNRFVAPKVLKRPGDLAAADAALADELPPILDYLEGVVPASGYLVEDRFTLADIAVASPFVNLGYVGVEVDAARWPRLAAWLEAIHARPSFAGLIAADKAFAAALG